MVNVHVFNIASICVHGEELLRQLAFHQEFKRSHNETDVRRICKIGSEQDEIYRVKTNNWENSSWKYLSLIGDEQLINLQRTEVHVFSDSVLCLELTASQWTSSGISSQDSIHCSPVKKFTSYC